MRLGDAWEMSKSLLSMSMRASWERINYQETGLECEQHQPRGQRLKYKMEEEKSASTYNIHSSSVSPSTAAVITRGLQTPASSAVGWWLQCRISDSPESFWALSLTRGCIISPPVSEISALSSYWLPLISTLQMTITRLSSCRLCAFNKSLITNTYMNSIGSVTIENLNTDQMLNSLSSH